jgi:hypothetical protein
VAHLVLPWMSCGLSLGIPRAYPWVSQADLKTSRRYSWVPLGCPWLSLGVLVSLVALGVPGCPQDLPGIIMDVLGLSLEILAWALGGPVCPKFLAGMVLDVPGVWLGIPGATLMSPMALGVPGSKMSLEWSWMSLECPWESLGRPWSRWPWVSPGVTEVFLGLSWVSLGCP